MTRLINAIKGTVAFVRLARDLDRLDDVFMLADTLREPALLREALEFHARTDDGRRALAARHMIGRVELAALRTLPDGTLGREFAEHMIRNQLDPAAIPTLPAATPEEYVLAHFYETHDIWHVVTGFATDQAGELGLQAFYLAQGPSRLSAMILGAGLLNLTLRQASFDDRDRRMDAIVRGWRMGRAARTLFGVRWDELWRVPLSEVRASLGIEPACDLDAPGAAPPMPRVTAANAPLAA